jgi:hypothetical protein
LRKGDAIVRLLFIGVLKIAVRRSKAEKRGNVFHKCILILAFADSVVIVGRRLQDVEVVLRILVEKTNKMGLEINEKRQNLLWYHASLTMKMNVCKLGA